MRMSDPSLRIARRLAQAMQSAASDQATRASRAAHVPRDGLRPSLLPYFALHSAPSAWSGTSPPVTIVFQPASITGSRPRPAPWYASVESV